VTRLAALACLLALTACPTTEGEDLPGYLCQVTVETVQDSCTPQRRIGDGGTQWMGAREDGGLAFTVLDDVKFGPTRAGEPLAGVSRDQFPPIDGGIAQFGADTLCRALIGGWRVMDGGLELNQQWPGFDACPAAPNYVPTTGCIAVRRLYFEPIVACSQRCVVLTNDGARCECPTP
jgi:hypothetical protein